MDIFSHGLWAGAAAKGLNKRGDGHRRLNVWATALWGVFPDLFAFGLPFIFIVWSVAFGGSSFSDFGGHSRIAEPMSADTLAVFQFSNALYNVSHSLIVFAAVFFSVWVHFKEFRLELLGWLVHILMDVPTHTYEFYPTPVFWPLFDWKFDGFSWGQPWFMVLNFTLLIIVYGVLLTKRGKGEIDKKG